MPLGLLSQGPEGLELLSHVRGMDQLQEGKLVAAEPAGFTSRHVGDVGSGVVHEERLLGLDRGTCKAPFKKGVPYPVPADMAGQVLLSRESEEIVALGVVPVGPRRPLGSGKKQFLPRLAIVKGEEKTGPGLVGEGPGPWRLTPNSLQAPERYRNRRKGCASKSSFEKTTEGPEIFRSSPTPTSFAERKGWEIP